MDLIQQLMEQLGIKEDQAKGGVGAVLKLAKDKLPGGDFSKLQEMIPGAQDLLGAAPDSSGGVMGAIGGMLSKLGGKAGSLGNLAGLAAGFEKLGLDKSMIQKFASTILGYVRGKGGDSVAGVLEGVLK